MNVETESAVSTTPVVVFSTRFEQHGHTRARACGEAASSVHGDDITICGQRTAVEFLIKMVPKKYETKQQVLGGDPDLEKSERILNRVFEWDRDGITLEADQRVSSRRQRHSTVGLSWSQHEGKPLSQRVD